MSTVCHSSLQEMETSSLLHSVGWSYQLSYNDKIRQKPWCNPRRPAARSQGRSISPWRIPCSREWRPPANSHKRPILAAAPPASSSLQMSSQPLPKAWLHHSLPEMPGQDHRDGVPQTPDWVSVKSEVACYAALGNRYTECHPASPHALLTQAGPPTTICK